MESNAGKSFQMQIARISLHFMLDPVQPLEYETGLLFPVLEQLSRARISRFHVINNELVYAMTALESRVFPRRNRFDKFLS